MIKELEYPSYANAGGFQRISWGAVFAGAFTSLAAMVTLTSFGVGMGLAALTTAQGSPGFGMASGIWMLISGIASFYAGGWIAGRLTGIARVSESVIHGIVAWSTATVMLAFVFTSVSIGGLGWIARASGAAGADGQIVPAAAMDQAMKATLEGQLAGAARFAFLMLACDAAAAALGARGGTRVLKPVVSVEIRRERSAV